MQNAETGTLKFIFLYLWSKNTLFLKLLFVLSVFLLFCSKIASAFVPFVFKLIFDQIENISKAESISVIGVSIPILMIFLYAGLRLASQILNELKEATFVPIEQGAVKKIALEVFSHIHSLSLKFHLNRKSGEITKSVERGIKSMEMILRFSTFNVIPTFVEIIFVCILLAALYPIYYMLVIFVTLVTYAAYTVGVTEWRTKYIRMMKVADNQSGHKAMDSLLNYETVKYFNNEEYEAKGYSRLLEVYRRLAVKNRVFLSILNLGQGVIIAAGLTVINYMTISDILLGSATIGDFALVNAYLLQLYQPLSNLGFAYREIKLAYIDIENMRLILQEKSDIKNRQNAKELVTTNGKVEFCNVSFCYNKKRKVLQDISFVIPGGTTTAIVGKSGSGKSTLARLLFRFYDPTHGCIKIDGQEIVQATQKSVHSVIGVVPQDTVLFNDTLRYNIAYGNPEFATEDDIKKASEFAEISDFIHSLPDSYNTLVGERGLKLSGGEKQRIAIARLLLKDPKILIFDEATSSLDTKTEKAIQKSIKKASSGKTTLIIAHRLSTVVDADQIIVLLDGKIVEKGSHLQLLAKKGLYWEMWENQKNQSMQ